MYIQRIAGLLQTFAIVCSLVLFCSGAYAFLQPAPLFSDGAVLQHGQPLPVFGQAAPGAQVGVSLRGFKVSVIANGEGRWVAWLPKQLPSNEPVQLTLESGSESMVISDVLIGEVWLAAGQSNMARVTDLVPDAAALLRSEPDDGLRLFRTAAGAHPLPQIECKGEWHPANSENSAKISAVAYYFARALRMKIRMPVGVVVSAWGGTRVAPWTPLERLRVAPELKVWLDEFEAARARRPSPNIEQIRGEFREEDYKNAPGHVFNSMIHPHVPYALQGVIWYQGESDAMEGYSDRYAKTYRAMIEGWRNAWSRPQMPFYSVQLPGFVRDEPTLRWASRKRPKLPASDFNVGQSPLVFRQVTFPHSSWPRLRLEQAATLDVPHSDMIVTIDKCDAFDLHPQNKDMVGRRLAAVALRDIHGDQSAGYYPRAVSARHEGDKRVRIKLTQAKGLKFTNEIAEFSTSSVDGPFQGAAAYIERDELVIIPLHHFPAARVRYAWGQAPLSSVTNEDGLPLGPFELIVEDSD